MSTYWGRFSMGREGRRDGSHFAKRLKRRWSQRPYGLELLEERQLLTASTLTIDGLQFIALGGFNQTGTSYAATGTVEVGFDPGADPFIPVMQLTGDITVNDDATPSFSVNGTVSEVVTQTPIPLFDGSQSFDIDSLINNGLSGLDGLTFDVAGVAFDLNKILLVSNGNNPEIQLQGALSVAGLTVAVDNTNSVDISKTGVTLTGVDATLQGSVTIGDVTFNADQLQIAYSNTNQNDVFTVTGSTSFTVSSSTIDVDWGGKTAKGTSTAGLVVENGSIKSLDMAVTGSVTVASLEFTANDLVVTYTDASSTYTITGGAKFQLTQQDAIQTATNDVSVQFGGTSGGHKTAGLVIVNGDLTQLDMTVDASFSLFGLTLAATGLVFEYQAAPNEQFIMYGDLALSSASQAFPTGNGQVFNGVKATLGDKTKPGLVVKDGVVEDVNVTVNGQFSLFSLSVAPKDLNVTYTRSQSTVEIVGGLDVTLAGAFKASTTLYHGGITVDTATGAVSVDGVKLDLSDVNLGAVTIQKLRLNFKQNKAKTETNFGAVLDLAFAGGWSVGASMKFTDGSVDDISVHYNSGTSQGIELGPSGLFLTSFSTSIDNIATGVLTITGSIAVDYGPHVTINGQSVAIISAGGDFTIDSSALTLTNVNVSVADGIIGTGNGTLIADWGAGNYSLTASLSLFDNIFNLSGTVQFNTAGDFLLVANASVEVPEQVPVIGGDTVAGMNFALKYLNNGGNPTGFIAAWDTISFLDISQSIGFEYTISGSISSGSFSLIGDDGVQQVESQLTLTPAGQDSEYGPQYFIGYFKADGGGLVAGPALNVPAGATTVSLLLSSPSGGFPGDVFILAPPSTPKTISWVLSLNPLLNPITTPQPNTFHGTEIGANFIIRQDTSTTVAVLIQTGNGLTLPAGKYALLYEPGWGISSPTAVNSFTYLQPQAATPAINATSDANEATLTASGLVAASLAGTTTVSFYATTSPTSHQGVFIGDVSTAQGGLSVGPDGAFSASLNWDASKFRPGSYYVYAVVKDGQNPPALSSNSSSPFTIQPIAKGVVTTADQPVAGATVQLFYNADPNNLPATPDQVAITGADGHYAFTSDASASPSSPVNFVVNLIVPAGYTIDSPTARSASYSGGQPATVNYNLKSSPTIEGAVTDPPLGLNSNTRTPIVGATVFLDLNRNGRLDPGEPETHSDSRGRYAFIDLDPGSYRVVTQAPEGRGASTPTSRDVAVSADSQRISGIDFGFYHLDSTPASSTPVYPGGGRTFGPIITTSVTGTAFDPRGTSAINAVLVSVRDLSTGLYWNGYHFVPKATPIQLTAEGTVSWRLRLPVASLISGHTYQVGSLALDAEGHNQVSPTYQTFTYKGPASANPPTLATTTSVVSSQPDTVVGQPVVFTVTVSPTAQGAGVPTGTVWLFDGSTVLASLPLQGGQATYQLDSLALGSHQIHAYYAGNAKYLATTSATITQSVAQVALQQSTAPLPEPRPRSASLVLNIGGASAGGNELVFLRPFGMGRFVQVRIVQADTGEVAYQARFRTRALRGIVVYDGPGAETVRMFGRLPIPTWFSQSGTLTPLSPSARIGAPFRGRLARLSAHPTTSARSRLAAAALHHEPGARPHFSRH